MKVLIIRFSSIGDIVLTTPLTRCVKKQLEACEVHYVTKKQFTPILENNPYIDKLIPYDGSFSSLTAELRAERYDHIIDLHKNIRTLLLRFLLFRRFSSFPKLNFKKWLLVRFKINLLPPVHIVDRYFRAVRHLHVKNDDQGLDYFIHDKDIVKPKELPSTHRNGYSVVVIGSHHNTKQLPSEQIIALARSIKSTLILLGGAADREKAEIIASALGEKAYNACGLYNINQSASILKNAKVVITPDTGLMHIAAAFRKNILSVWGNTVPGFGMYPYLPSANKNNSIIFEVKDLSCRPCSKLGYEKCPKGHFDCMKKINVDKIAETANNLLDREL